MNRRPILRALSQREHRLASCVGKERFTSWHRANVAATRKRRNGEATTVYRCFHCPHYHIGSSHFKCEHPKHYNRREFKEVWV